MVSFKKNSHMRTVKHLIISVLLFMTYFSSSAQHFRSYQQWNIGAHVGYNAFWGDITDNGNHIIPGGPFQQSFYQDRNIMYGAWLGKDFNKKVSFRSQFIYGYIVGTSNFDKKRFVSSNREFNITFAFDLVDFFDGDPKSPWDWYVYGGAGILSFRSSLTSMNSGEVLRYAPFDSLKYASKQRIITPVFPFGMGVNYKIGTSLRLTLETSIRTASSDWLDSEVSKKRSLEGYTYTSFGITYVFDFPRKGGIGSWRSGSFDAMSDNSAKQYRKKRNNGSISSNPFRNQAPRRGSAKIKSPRRGKTFKTPK